ncbi:DUF2637 domain-containing protein [Nonomuraea lactucae]|uniref:DUF2637 domain-containing protein n=1 Tax=Nonomuraea lactucae TaxID=2249762 RepID=UPI001F06A4F0|nr:DUF2637 domain-containing protein [Nonomuraea lactucae]
MIRWSTTVVVVLLATVAAIVSYRHAYEVITANGESGWVAYLVPLTIDGLIFASSMVLLDCARRGLEVPWLARVALVLGIAATLAANVMHGWSHGPVGAIVAAWPAVALVLSYELLMGVIRRGAVSVTVATNLRSNLTEVADKGEEPTPIPVEVRAPAVPATVGVTPMVGSEGVTVDTLEPVEAPADNLVVIHHEVHPLAVPSQLVRLPGAGKPTHGADLDGPAPEVEVQPERVPEPDPDAPYRPVAVAHFLAEVAQGQTPTVRTIKDRMNVSTDRAGRLRRYLAGLVEVAQ